MRRCVRTQQRALTVGRENQKRSRSNSNAFSPSRFSSAFVPAAYGSTVARLHMGWSGSATFYKLLRRPDRSLLTCNSGKRHGALKHFARGANAEAYRLALYSLEWRRAWRRPRKFLRFAGDGWFGHANEQPSRIVPNFRSPIAAIFP
jgi:hypothetical protein